MTKAPSSALRSPSSETEHPEFDFEHDLPFGVESFALHWLAARWKCSVPHVTNLVAAGEFGKDAAFDLRGAQSSKAMVRIRRAAVVEFLNRRKNIEAVAEKSPQPKPREKAEKKTSNAQRPTGKNGSAK
jgi:hypothetical protein